MLSKNIWVSLSISLSISLCIIYLIMFLLPIFEVIFTCCKVLVLNLMNREMRKATGCILDPLMYIKGTLFIGFFLWTFIYIIICLIHKYDSLQMTFLWSIRNVLLFSYDKLRSFWCYITYALAKTLLCVLEDLSKNQFVNLF